MASHDSSQRQTSPNFKAFILRNFSKLTCFSTLFLIFAGGMVTSTGSGLAVPDWPLSYGSLFPPMVGGVFYEHGHRMVATVVGFFMLCLAFMLWRWQDKKWVKVLGFVALGAVIIQGILGGITVKFFLPTPISVSHGILAQTFLILTVILAYSQSNERMFRDAGGLKNKDGLLLRAMIGFIVLVYLQLGVGAVMRHTGSGLAIPDFPTHGGYWWPPFDAQMLYNINDWRFEQGLPDVTLTQVMYHFIHRLGAVVIMIYTCVLMVLGYNRAKFDTLAWRSIRVLGLLIALQITLGISTVVTGKSPQITSFHVVTGAAILAWSVLVILRIAPVRWDTFKQQLKS